MNTKEYLEKLGRAVITMKPGQSLYKCLTEELQFTSSRYDGTDSYEYGDISKDPLEVLIRAEYRETDRIVNIELEKRKLIDHVS